jgi:hypothetical protein
MIVPFYLVPFSFLDQKAKFDIAAFKLPDGHEHLNACWILVAPF